jgi:excisionase family DNA binding protein
MPQMLLRAAEAARAPGNGRSKLYALVAAGQPPVIRIGTSTRIPAAALERWVEERTISCGMSAVVTDTASDHTFYSGAARASIADTPSAGEDLPRGIDEKAIRLC